MSEIWRCQYRGSAEKFFNWVDKLAFMVYERTEHESFRVEYWPIVEVCKVYLDGGGEIECSELVGSEDICRLEITLDLKNQKSLEAWRIIKLMLKITGGPYVKPMARISERGEEEKTTAGEDNGETHIFRQEILTENEEAVGRGILKGRTNKEIAFDMRISLGAVKNFVHRLYVLYAIDKNLTNRRRRRVLKDRLEGDLKPEP